MRRSLACRASRVARRCRLRRSRRACLREALALARAEDTVANRRAALYRAAVGRRRRVGVRGADGARRKVARNVVDRLAVEARRGLCLWVLAQTTQSPLRELPRTRSS